MSVAGLTPERKQAVKDFGRHRRRKLKRIVLSESNRWSPALLIAIGLRESLLAQKIGGGTDRGVFQINDYYGEHFLRTHRGCRVDSYVPIYASAYPKGRCPTLADGLRHALYLLNSAYHFGSGAGVPAKDLHRFAVAAYNCGAGGALEGYRKGNVDLNTANGDYSADVMKLRDELADWLK